MAGENGRSGIWLHYGGKTPQRSQSLRDGEDQIGLLVIGKIHNHGDDAHKQEKIIAQKEADSIKTPIGTEDGPVSPRSTP